MSKGMVCEICGRGESEGRAIALLREIEEKKPFLACYWNGSEYICNDCGARQAVNRGDIIHEESCISIRIKEIVHPLK